MREVIKINDIVFGEIIIDESVIVELIKSKPMQRLKGIDSGCYAPLYNNPKNLDINLLKGTRFDHSIGVYYLLKRYNDSLEAQISGLLHDVSHTAFSHGADYIFDEGCEKSHDFQDKHHEQVIKNSVIPKILNKYGFDVDRIINEVNFPLLENNIPDLCADRIDYSFRTAVHFQEYTKDEVDEILSHLKAKDNKWYFDNFEFGQKFVDLFKKMNDDYYSDIKAAILYGSISKIMRYAINRDHLKKEDFFKDDEYVMNKIKVHLGGDKELAEYYKKLNDKGLYRGSRDKSEVEVYLKSRIVDPWVRDNDKLKRLSEINKDWAKVVKEDLKPRKYYLEEI